jgi:pimeloyl-ACP methyl ester carboxylesterase
MDVEEAAFWALKKSSFIIDQVIYNGLCCFIPMSRRIGPAGQNTAEPHRGGIVTTHAENALPAALRGLWPYVPRFANVNGWRMQGEGDPVVLLHGNPTWGFLYRDIIGPLVKSGRRVIVPDMIGFGLSEKPIREQAHTLDGHTANLTARSCGNSTC